MSAGPAQYEAHTSTSPTYSACGVEASGVPGSSGA